MSGPVTPARVRESDLPRTSAHSAGRELCNVSTMHQTAGLTTTCAVLCGVLSPHPATRIPITLAKERRAQVRVVKSIRPDEPRFARISPAKRQIKNNIFKHPFLNYRKEVFMCCVTQPDVLCYGSSISQSNRSGVLITYVNHIFCIISCRV